MKEGNWCFSSQIIGVNILNPDYEYEGAPNGKTHFDVETLHTIDDAIVFLKMMIVDSPKTEE